MNITITTEEKDSALLEGFAKSTGWSERSGSTLEDWIQAKVSEWITRQARSGSVMLQTDVARTQYVTAVRSAQDASKVIIQPPVVSAELAGTKTL